MEIRLACGNLYNPEKTAVWCENHACSRMWECMGIVEDELLSNLNQKKPVSEKSEQLKETLIKELKFTTELANVG